MQGDWKREALDSFKSFLSCDRLILRYPPDEYGRALKRRRDLYRLIIDLAFVPQMVWATVLYMYVKGESAVLLDNFLAQSLLAAFITVLLCALVNLNKRFYFTRFVAAGAYALPLATAVFSAYSAAYLRFGLLMLFGISINLISICALYGWRNMPKNSFVHERKEDEFSA